MDVKNEYSMSKVVVLKVGQADVDGILINYDLTDESTYSYMEKELVDVVMNYLPEYAMGYDNSAIAPVQMISILREAAKSIIKIKKVDEIKRCLDAELPPEMWDPEILKLYNSKGVFSELILHFILRELKGTIPLISKIYFKDSNATEAHGFDAVHVTQDSRLWLGETKFYNNGKRGIMALIEDLNNHFKHDYLKDQFVIINRALVRSNEMREEWIKSISSAVRLEEKFDMIVIPLLCIYEDSTATDIIKAINEGMDADIIYLEHASSLKEYFDKNNNFINKYRVQALLILLPVESKNRIVAEMLSRIYSMQNI